MVCFPASLFFLLGAIGKDREEREKQFEDSKFPFLCVSCLRERIVFINFHATRGMSWHVPLRSPEVESGFITEQVQV